MQHIERKALTEMKIFLLRCRCTLDFRDNFILRDEQYFVVPDWHYGMSEKKKKMINIEINISFNLHFPFSLFRILIIFVFQYFF